MQNKLSRKLQCDREAPWRISSCGGQALLELVSLLFVLLLMCLGMIFLNRIIQFDWWAQEEARFLAFEKTWVPAMKGGNPVAKLEAHGSFFRPRFVDKASVSREVNMAGSLSDLLRGSNPHPPPPPPPPPPPRNRCWSTGINSYCCSNGFCSDGVGGGGYGGGGGFPMGAVSRLEVNHEASQKDRLLQTSDEWLGESLIALKSLTLPAVKNAYAVGRHKPGSVPGDSHLLEPREAWIPKLQRSELEESFVETLENAQFGEDLCAVMGRTANRRGFPLLGHAWMKSDCAVRHNSGFGIHIAENINVRGLRKSIEQQLSGGRDPSQAIDFAFRKEMANQFYAYFDKEVRNRARTAPLSIVADRAKISKDVLQDKAVRRMLLEMRYLGSVVAMTKIAFEFGRISSEDPRSYSSADQIRFERSVNRILHADGEKLDLSGVHIPGNGYWFPLTKLPVPPFWGVLGADLFEGAMSNVLSEDRGLYHSQVEHSNVNSSVSYWGVRRVLQDDPTGKFKTWDPHFGARMFLVTQPWHITRRQSADGSFRGMGNQRDSSSSSSEEGVLRRRVKGLWFFPSDVVALIKPATEAIPHDLQGPVDFLENTSRTAITDIKKIATDDNPLQKIFHLLNKLRGITHIEISLPEWPAVRPEAYPDSVEMKRDRMTGSNRHFSDYIEEQKKH